MNQNNHINKTRKALDINVIRHTIRDIRNELLKEYPSKNRHTILMQKDLCNSYRNGTPLINKVELGKGAGYFKPEKR